MFRNLHRVVSAAAFAVLSFLLAVPQLHAQVLYGSIVGQVTDATSAAIPAATVKLTHTETGQVRTATASEGGTFNFPTLPGGTYEVMVTKEGFQPFTVTGINVGVDTVVRLDPKLQVGGVSQSVEVSSAAATLQTDRAEVRGEVSSTSLENLPVPVGRNYQNLLITVPGLSPPTNQHSVAANPARGLTFNSNGTTRNANNVRIDGASSNNVWLPHVTAYVPGLEAIQEVSVVTNSFSAEQGLSGGVAVNVQIKSGTNQLHGSGFEYHTDNALKAKPFFLPTNQGKPKLVNNQAGGTIGGPILKNKLFFFGSYDGSFDRELGAGFFTVPTADVKAGNMSASSTLIYDPSTGNADGTARTPFPGNVVPTARMDPVAVKLAGLTPLPNAPGLTGNYYATGGYNVTRHKLDGKLSYNPTDKLTITGRTGWLNYNFVDPPAFGTLGGPPVNSAGGKIGNGFGNVYSTTFSATYVVRPNLIVDGYFGFTLSNTNQEPPRLDENLGLNFLGLPGTNGTSRLYGGWPQFSVTSFDALGNPGSGGTGGPIYYGDTNYQYTVNSTWTKSAHAVRFGVDLARQSLNHFETSSSAGTFNFAGGPTTLKGGTQSASQFNNYAAFLLGQTSSVSKDILPFDNSLMTSREWEYSLYVQDQWQLTNKVTVNYGVRWDYFPVGRRATRGLERYNFQTNQMQLCGVGSIPSDCGYSTPKTNFSPRLGIAWRPTDKLVVRTGFGMNYDPYPLAFVRDMLTNYPEDLLISVNTPSSFVQATQLKNGIPAITVPDTSSGLINVPAGYQTRSLAQNIKTAYVASWNFTLQRELPWGFTGQAGYVASRQVAINGILDLNDGLIPGAGSAGQPFFPLFGRTVQTALLTPVGHNKYDSLQSQLSRRFSKGFQVQFGYTFSKTVGICCDDLSDGAPTSGALTFINLARAVMPFDRTHDFTTSFVADLPFGKGKAMLNSNGFASKLAGGWRINSLVAAYSGQPFSVSASNTSLNLPNSTQRADQIKSSVAIIGGTGPGQSYFDPLAFAPVTTARFGTAGYDTLRGPGFFNIDFSLFRNFAITERFHAEFRAEALNLTNTPHFANPPSGNLSVSNLQLNSDGSVKNLGGFGVINATTGTGREGIDERMFRLGLRLSF